MTSLPSTSVQRHGGHTTARLVLLGILLAVAALALPDHSTAAPGVVTKTLVGTLELTPGSCAGGKVTGTYLRMILPSGHANGPYMSNSDSRCSDQTFTPLSPGSDGGLRVGAYQPSPTPRFSANGNATAHRITAPAAFYGTSFATATSPVDPQTRTSVPAPRVRVSGTRLTADLRSFAVTWNNQDFNQGAPKPDGTSPGNTTLGTGSYDAGTGAFSLNWASQVVGGPFDKFTGSWHFEGRFVPAGGTTAPGSTGQHPTTVGGTSTSTSDGSGAVATPGTATAAGKPVAGKPATALGVPAAVPVVDAPAAAPVTKVVTTDRWRVSWPVVGLAVGIGLLALGALVLSSVLSRREGSR